MHRRASGGRTKVFHDVRGDGRRPAPRHHSRRGCLRPSRRAPFPSPGRKAKVYVEGRKLLVAGRALERDPRTSAADAARWIEEFLWKSTGKRSRASHRRLPRLVCAAQRFRRFVWVIEPRLCRHFSITRRRRSTADVAARRLAPVPLLSGGSGRAALAAPVPATSVRRYRARPA